MKYRAIRDNYGFQGRYWSAGETVDAKTKPNDHFAPVAGQNEVDEPVEQPAEVADEQAETPEAPAPKRHSRHK